MLGLLLIFSIIFLTYIVLYNDKDITITILKTYLLQEKYDRKTTAFLLSLIFPITLTQYIYLKLKNKMSLKRVYTIIIAVLVIFALAQLTMFTANELITFNNTEIDYSTQFEQKKSERISFYDKMFKQVSTTTEIALRNDSSFTNLVNIVMNGQPTNLSAMFGMVRLIDPSANYEQVTQFYSYLTQLANANREGFFQQEVALQNINKEHNNLLLKFPGSFYNLYFKRSKFDYKPILSTISNNVDKTGIDDNYKILTK